MSFLAGFVAGMVTGVGGVGWALAMVGSNPKYFRCPHCGKITDNDGVVWEWSDLPSRLNWASGLCKECSKKDSEAEQMREIVTLGACDSMH